MDPALPRIMTRKVLRYGIYISIGFAVLGAIMIFISFRCINSNFTQLISSGGVNENLLSAFSISDNATRLSDFLAGVGMIALVAIPIARIGLTICEFACERETFYTVIAVLVLIVLAISFLVVGPMEAGYGLFHI